jgi:hypothetical protein
VRTLVEQVREACWFAKLPDAGECVGPTVVRCHLISQQAMRHAFPKGAVKVDGRWLRPRDVPANLEDWAPIVRTLKQLQDDERSWVPGCGGLVGLAGHHGRVDTAPHERTRLRVPRSAIPADTEEYAIELGLEGWLARTYGEDE